MARDRWKWGLCLLGIGLALPQLAWAAEAQEEPEPEFWEEQVECKSREEAEAYGFPEEKQIGGQTYRLARIEIQPLEAKDSSENQTPRIEWVASPVIPSGEAYKPEQELIRDGIRYRLLRTEQETVEPEEGGQVVEGTRTYSGVTERPDIPEQAEFEVWDENRQETCIALLSLARLQEVWSWREDFQAVLTASPAGAAEYQLGGQIVKLGEETPGVERYEAAVLAELGLEPDCFRIQGSQWAGEAYLSEEGWKREILVTGKRYAADYTAWYIGELPPQTGVVYRSVYQEVLEPKEETPVPYLAKAVYRREDEKASAFPPAALSAGAGALTAGIFLIVWRRKKTRRKPERGERIVKL